MTTFSLIVSGLYLIPALAWAIISGRLWLLRHQVRQSGSRSRTFLLAPIATTVIAFHAFQHVAWFLLPIPVRETPPGILLVTFELSALASLALGRHMLAVLPIPEPTPSRRWLVVNYGGSAVVALVYAVSLLLPDASGNAQRLVSIAHPPSTTTWTLLTVSEISTRQWYAEALLYLSYVVLGTLCLWQVVRIARPGVRGLTYGGDILRYDLLVFGVASVVAAGVFALLAVMGWSSLASILLEIGMGLAIAAPIVLSMLPVFLPEFIVMVTLLATIGAVLISYRSIASLIPAPFHPLTVVTAVLTLGFLLTAGEEWLRTVIHRILFRRSRRQQAELQASLHTLSPALGVVECCRRALVELIRVRQLRGAAIILHDGETVAVGEFNLAPLVRVWPRGADAEMLPTRYFGSMELRTLPEPLRDAMAAANVGLGSAPIISPRRRWGHLFMNTGLLGGIFQQEDVEAFEAFVAQLALQLDAADLLARAVAVERSLAHAEKLAAIGELTARIVHEIRNPVTAARSLAQALAADATAETREPAQLILEELERVEREVAALLRFARREEYRFESVDLAQLVRTTLNGLRPRLEAAGIEVATEISEPVAANADREKLRQALINLVENAMDALANGAAVRRIAVSVAGTNGSARVCVTDSGPGVPDAALPQLFEPFFSLKEKGTGLGLAIVKRTVEAHGGRVTASPGADGGVTFQVEMPLVSSL